MPQDKLDLILEDMADTLSLLTGKSKGLRSSQLPTEYNHLKIASVNDAQLFFNTDGIFVDCSMASAVFNTLIQPLSSLANLMPVRPTNEELVTYGFLTQLTEGGTTPPDYPCDPAPAVGEASLCKASFGIGRLAYRTKTLELDALIRRAHRGANRQDFYFVGDVRGVSAMPSATDLQDRDFIYQSAVRRQMSLVLRRFQRTLTSWLWIGDPTDNTQNGAHGGWKSFYGLTHLIADDYGSGTKPGISGTNCAALNSLVFDFTEGATRSGVVGEQNLYEYLQEMADILGQRSSLMGLDPVRWLICMHPILWSQIVKALPCDMVSDGCNLDGAVANLNDGANGLYNLAMRKEMANSKTIELNGNIFEVFTDDSIPYQLTGTSYTSSIFFVPMEAAGEETLVWRTMDYTLFANEIAELGDNHLLGWSDGGRYHWIVEQLRRCFEVEAKMEMIPEFTAPFLAGRIDKVTVQTVNARPAARSAVSSYQLG